MKISVLLISIAFILSAFMACEEAGIFSQTPSERSQQHMADLHQRLTSSPYGWQVVLFPKTDSLLFTNPGQKIGEYDFEPEDLGYGGFTAVVDFLSNGTMRMFTDEEPDPDEYGGEYRIAQGMMTRLSFTTYTALHRWVNDDFGVSPDWFFLGVDADGYLRFRTGSYLETAREYIALRPISTMAARDTLLSAAYANRLFFEQMRNPQIHIRKGDRTYFRSDYFIKVPRRASAMKAHRYAFFLFEKERSLTGDFPKEANGLGAGYTGTPEGLTFRTGFQLNSTYIFHDFLRVGQRFICELVEVYDPLTRQTRLAARHLYPEGRPTEMVAEIYDQP